MRARRGNYIVLFTLTVAVMLSYLAFSIDGSRTKLALNQVENAAEAAALVAVATVRDGGTRSQAQARASAAANAIEVTGVKTKAASPGGDTFAVDVTWGRWDWNEGLESRDSRWERAPGRQAAEVSVRLTGGGMTTVFGPAIGLVGGRNNDKGYGSKPTGNFGSVEITVKSKAAMRHRDIVVAVDASRFVPNTMIDDIRDGLVDFLDEIEDLGVPGDRVAFVTYAGDAHNYNLLAPGELTYSSANVQNLNYGIGAVDQGTTLFTVDGNEALIGDVLERYSLCDVGPEAWYFAYRFLRPDVDRELVNGGAVGSYSQSDYWVLDENQNPALTIQDFTDNTQNAGLLTMIQLLTPLPGITAGSNLDVVRTAYLNGGPYDDGLQCALWRASETLFALSDERRELSNLLGHRSPLPCHLGNWWEGDPNRIAPVGRAARTVDCPAFAGSNLDGTPRYESPDGTFVMRLDRSYLQAGSNPGVALARAADIFQAQDSSAEPTVVLITPNPPRCGPNLEGDPLASGFCLDTFEDLVNAGQDALEDLEANTHVIALTQPGSAADAYLSTLPTGRGYYIVSEASSNLGEILSDQIAHDIRVQVVQ